MSFETEIRELTGQYWDIAFHEGKSGKSNGDLAGKILHNIEEAVSRMQTEVEALRKDAERYQWLRRMGVGLSLSHQVISQFVTNQGELDAVIANDTQDEA